MKLGIVGASGATGKVLVDQSLAAGHSVVAVVRNPADVVLKHAQLSVVQGQATQQADLEKLLAGCDAVLSCVGSRTRKANTVRSETAKALVGALPKLGIKRLVWLSSSGVGDSADFARRTSFVFGRIIMPLFLTDVFADSAVAEDLVRATSLDWVIVRPVGLNDKPAAKNVIVSPLSGKAPRSYISRADVAAFMLDACAGDTYVKQLPIIC